MPRKFPTICFKFSQNFLFKGFSFFILLPHETATGKKDTNFLILRSHKTLCHFRYHKMYICSSWIRTSCCFARSFKRLWKTSSFCEIGNENLSRYEDRNCRSIKFPFPSIGNGDFCIVRHEIKCVRICRTKSFFLNLKMISFSSHVYKWRSFPLESLLVRWITHLIDPNEDFIAALQYFL